MYQLLHGPVHHTKMSFTYHKRGVIVGFSEKQGCEYNRGETSLFSRLSSFLPCHLAKQKSTGHHVTDAAASSLHHGQVFERVAPVLLGFVSRSEELNLPLLGFNFILVLFEFLLGCDVWVCHRLGREEGANLNRLLKKKLCYGGRLRCHTYLHGSVAFACCSPLGKLFLHSREGQRESLQPHLFFQQLYQLLRQVLQCGICQRASEV